MSMFDEARSISTMLKMRNMTQAEIAKMLGVSQPYIANKLRLLSYSPTCEELICKYALSERHARAILRLGTEKARIDAIEKSHERGFTVYECEGLVDMMREEELPRLFEHQLPGVRMVRFLENLDESVRTLRSLGFKINKTTSYHAGQTFVTLRIDEKREFDNF